MRGSSPIHRRVDEPPSAFSRTLHLPNPRRKSRSPRPPSARPSAARSHWRDETLRALVDALDLREQETAGHSHRVATWTLLLAACCRIPVKRQAAIYAGALLHDVGKIAIPDRILRKRGRLDRSEWATMRTHPQAGRALLARTSSLRDAAAIPWCHHERYDGGGYPRGLAGKRIPLGARLFTIVDVYDALRSRRSYKRAWSHRESLAMIAAAAGQQFDPELCAAFARLPEAILLRVAPRAGTRYGYAHVRLVVGRALKWLRRHHPDTIVRHGKPKLEPAASSPRARVKSTPRTRSSRRRSGS